METSVLSVLSGSSMTIPFGKYKGRNICEVPTDYLDWLLSLSDLKCSFRYAVQDELRRRFAPPPPPKKHQPQLRLDIADAWRRKMAFEFHPDRGGTVEGMRAINRGYEYLRELMARST